MTRDAVDSSPSGAAGRRALIVRIVLLAAVIAALVIRFRLLPVAEWLMRFQTYVRGLGALGYLVYALAYAACCVFFVPASVLTLGAGAIFGIVKGSIVVIAGATLGATLAFLLARTVMRHRIEAMTSGNAKFSALDKAITAEGAKIVFLIRLAPVFPFTYINYAFGLTGIAVLPYVVATFLGIVPATVAFVYLGHAAADAATAGTSTARTAINVAGAVVALIASIFVARVATKAIGKAGVQQ